MAQIPPLLPSSFVHVILRSVANVLSEHVEKVFQGIARMSHTSNFILDQMSGMLSHMFEDSRDVLITAKESQVFIVIVPIS